MKRFLLALFLLSLPLAAQEEKKAEAKEPATVQKLFVLKYADPQSVRNLLQVFHANLDANRDLRVLAVDATPETMAAIEDAIKRLDVPSAAPANIDLTVYLLVGHEGESPTGNSPVPKDLDSVVTQLKNAFAFKSYSLLDVLALRARTGEQASTTSSGASVQNGNATAPVMTNFRINGVSLGGDGTTIHISRLNAGINMPVPDGSNGFNRHDLGLNTDVDIKEGQKVVIGRLGISKDQALFLVMTAKILQ
ncbi:MAG TPA: hypothetical protein VMB03_15340 [Bryobacteraceae bacterium]|nr:hypothetical protein [Bryobacteraceae bacterium]